MKHIPEENFKLLETTSVSKDIFAFALYFQGLFTPFEITSIQETTLGANQWLKDNSRIKFEASGNLEDVALKDVHSFNKTELEAIEKWTSDGNDLHQQQKRAVLIEVPEDNINDLIIALKPMQIRTFVIEIKKSDI